ncbi:MAG: c-type cytochrome [Halieaceae bacterium]
MFNWVSTFGLIAAAMGIAATAPASELPAGLEVLGRPATENELTAWDIDVRPDFLGLPPGQGDVWQGEEIWLEKCAACHGDFGDSNEVFAPIVLGNITEEDIESGRVAALQDSAVARTTLMKVATLSTLWDYIYRAMPWNAPKSLTPDEVYALLAYILNLGYIVEDDLVLSDANIQEIQLRMPNRNGMTRLHGLWSVNGQPDVNGDTCDTACEVDVAVSSSLPDYALNAHGNLAEQVRDWSPFPGLWTSPEPMSDSSVVAVADPDPETLLSQSGCTACHQMAGQLVGPGFDAIRARYTGEENAAYLAQKIVNGGAGVWGAMPMPAMSGLNSDTVERIVLWLTTASDQPVEES